VVILTTKLDANAMNSLQLLKLRFEDRLEIVDSYSSAVTHVITAARTSETSGKKKNVKQTLLPARTMKYFKGLLGGQWVLTIDWVHESLEKGKLVDEGNFLVHGDPSALGGAKRARNATAPLFAGFNLVVHGECGGPKMEKDIESLVILGGGIVHDASFFQEQENEISGRKRTLQWIVLAFDEIKARELLRSKSEIARLCRKHRIPIVTCLWLFDCISSFQVLPFPKFEEIDM